MPITVPNQMATGWAPLKSGFDTGVNFYDKLVNQGLTRAQQQRLVELLPLEKKQKLAAIANAQAANSRAAQLQPLRLQALRNKLDPNYEFNSLVKMLNGGQSNTGTTPTQGMGGNNAGTMDDTGIEGIGNMPGVGMPQPNNMMGEGAGMMRAPGDEGLLKPGNINLNNRPVVKNPKGGYSTVASMGIGIGNGREALIPTVSDDGRMLSEQEAIDQFKKTGKHLGIFDSTEAANQFAENLHRSQEQQYGEQINQQEQKGTGNKLTDALERLRNDNTPEGIAKRIIIAKKYPGLLKASAEPPEMKRAAELRDKMAVAKYNHELKQAEAQEKAEAKSAEGRQKIVTQAQNDLPHLATTLESLKAMKAIADDPKNDDMFGHWWIGNDAAAQRTSNPNAGVWQVNGLGPIVEAEMKMSAKGNQLALKSALGNKPNFAENRKVAAKKIDTQISQIERRIAETKKLAGMKAEVTVIDPNGKKFTTTPENAAHLPEGWRHG